MAQEGRVLSAKSEDLGLISRTFMMEGENQLCELSSDSQQVPCHAHAHTHMANYINAYEIERKKLSRDSTANPSQGKTTEF